jgi:hypothetical protein
MSNYCVFFKRTLLSCFAFFNVAVNALNAATAVAANLRKSVLPIPVLGRMYFSRHVVETKMDDFACGPPLKTSLAVSGST